MRWIFRGVSLFKVFSPFYFMKMAINPVSVLQDKSLYTLQRIKKVTGDEHKTNDLILCTSLKHSPITGTVIFFGGDVQNYPEIMAEHRTNNIYSQWNLENTARILAQRFPGHLIIVVKPSNMLLNTFSIYSNFVEFDEDGIPTLFTDVGAVIHLSKLYSNALKYYCSKKLCDTEDGSHVCSVSSNGDSCSSHMISNEEDHPITIVGFSKGCVPLNQIMFELSTTNLPPDAASFSSKIKSVYWLDAGHNGRKDTWITNDFVLQKIVSTNIQLYIHVTPYQIKDLNRPWVGKEKKKFIQKLKSFHANFIETEHHFDMPGSLDLHFSILTEF